VSDKFSVLLNLIRQGKISIEINQVGQRPFLKSLWLKFCYAYIRFRAVRDYECFQNAYQSEIIRLHLEDGRILSYPAPWENALASFNP